MLLELRVQNLLLIESAEIRLGKGLTTITGETGAGKTMLAQALDLLMGGKPRSGIVRPGAEEAYVEGLFEVPASLWERDELQPLAERLQSLDDSTRPSDLTLARRVSSSGRSRALIDGRAASAQDLALLGGHLISFYGQHEHRKLTLQAAQLEILDRFQGAAQTALLGRHREVFRDLSKQRRRLAELEESAGRSEREQSIMRFELEEIEELNPREDEHTALGRELDRIGALEDLRSAAQEITSSLEPEEGAGASTLIARAEAAAGAQSGSDPEIAALSERLSVLLVESQDIASEARLYLSGLEADPERMAEVEERLAEYARLIRKFGGTIGMLLERAEECRKGLSAIDGQGEEIEAVKARIKTLSGESDDLARKISAARKQAAPKLARAVLSEMQDLALEDATFEVRLIARERRATGDEAVEFMIAPNPGVEAQPLRESASGGELSRTMLALLSVAHEEGDELLVFDEVDAGIGGLVARAVGERLVRLGQERQVLCITHLPQIASLAQRHLKIAKEAKGKLARTEVSLLEGEEIVSELQRMLGSEEDSETARRHAEELLSRA